jgi:predicted secreted protein
MQITSALVLLAVIWFLTLFIVLPIKMRTQGDENRVTMGTPAGAPARIDMRRKVKITSLVAVVIWVPLCAVILSGWIGIDDFDLFNRFGGGLPRLE